MSKLWVDPPEGWKHGFPAIYDSETDGQMSEWIISKGYPVQTIKEYGEQWHIRCWSAEEPDEKKYPDKDISAQKQSKDVKNAPIGTEMRKTTREEKISRPAVYEVPANNRMIASHQDHVRRLMEELALARVLIRELGDRLAKLEKPWVGFTQTEIAEFVKVLERGNYLVAINKIEQALKQKNT